MKIRPLLLALALALVFGAGGPVWESGTGTPAAGAELAVFDVTPDAGDDAGAADEPGMTTAPDPVAIDQSTRLFPVSLAAAGPPARRSASLPAALAAAKPPRAGSSPRYLAHCALLC